MKKEYGNVLDGLRTIRREATNGHFGDVVAGAVVLKSEDGQISVFTLGKDADVTFDLLEDGVDELARIDTT